MEELFVFYSNNRKLMIKLCFKNNKFDLVGSRYCNKNNKQQPLALDFIYLIQNILKKRVEVISN